jgi:hypothetical protein
VTQTIRDSLGEDSANEGAEGEYLANERLVEAREILAKAQADSTDKPKSVASTADLKADPNQYDPMASAKSDGSVSENGINIINSFINRTVFFDYFRHVAHKRFPDLEPDERVESLIRTNPKLYERAMNSDHVLKLVTSYLIILASGALIFKALFM